MAQLRIDHVRKSFGKTEVLKGVDLDIKDGEFIVLLGASGCGKSTLLRIIAGLEAQTSGRVLIGGRPVDHLPPAKRGIAMVFQSYALYPHLDVAGNWALGLRQAGESRRVIEERTREAARILELESLLRRKPAELSGGQRQRVAIGRAIVKHPKLFLLDEPLSNLDAALRAAVRFEIARLHKQLGATMVYVTHDQVEAMTMADKIVVLQAGIVEQAGTPLELYHHPRNQFVAGFIGSPKMNFLPAKVAAVDGAGAGVTVELPGGATLALPMVPGNLKAGEAVTFGVRPEHLRPGAAGEITGEVTVVERLGGETFLYVQLAGGGMIVVQADGEIPTRVHERITVKLDPVTCHLFDGYGLAVQRTQRHPLADMRRPTAAKKAS